jgi:hypothetical protein
MTVHAVCAKNSRETGDHCAVNAHVTIKSLSRKICETMEQAHCEVTSGIALAHGHCCEGVKPERLNSLPTVIRAPLDARRCSSRTWTVEGCIEWCAWDI